MCVFTHMHVQALSVNGSGLQKVPWRDSSVNSCCSNKVHLQKGSDTQLVARGYMDTLGMGAVYSSPTYVCTPLCTLN